jgi:hypothetical protein
VGRFISEDLIEFEGGDFNVLRYAANFSVGRFDSKGLLSTIEAGAIVGAVAGSVAEMHRQLTLNPCLKLTEMDWKNIGIAFLMGGFCGAWTGAGTRSVMTSIIYGYYIGVLAGVLAAKTFG